MAVSVPRPKKKMRAPPASAPAAGRADRRGRVCVDALLDQLGGRAHHRDRALVELVVDVTKLILLRWPGHAPIDVRRAPRAYRARGNEPIVAKGILGPRGNERR